MRLSIQKTTDGKFIEAIVDTEGSDDRPVIHLGDYKFAADYVVDRGAGVLDIMNSNYRITATRLEG
jgi:hypothetical protein